MTPEARARADIDRLLEGAGWHLCDYRSANIHAARGVAIREFELSAGHGTADYLLYVDGKAAGVVEAKKQGATLTGVERQSDRYTKGRPTALPASSRTLPFAYESTGVETRFTNGLDPEPRSGAVFAFHRPETLAEWLDAPVDGVKDAPAASASGRTMLARLQHRRPLVTEWGEYKLWPAQIQAILNLEASLAQNKPRALIQMATGSGKTVTAISFMNRLIKLASARGACSSSWTAATWSGRPRKSSTSTSRPSTITGLARRLRGRVRARQQVRRQCASDARRTQSAALMASLLSRLGFMGLAA